MNRTLAAAAVFALAGAAFAQPIAFTGAYSQDFNSLPSTGSTTLTGRGPHAFADGFPGSSLSGWYGANLGGSSSNTEFRAQNGSLAGSTGRGVVSFGADASAERALGALPTSNQISSFGALFSNASNDTINEITITFTAEQWRRGSVTEPNRLLFTYDLASSIDLALTPFGALDAVSPNMQASPTEVAIDGNDPGNQALVSATLTNLAWAPGSTLAIRWTINDITGQDNGLAIDNLSIVPAPGSLALLGIGLAACTRRRR